IAFQLAFYCNVSDAWLPPEKSKRLWVTLAGPYVELVLWAIAVLTWRFTGADTWLSAMALVVVVTSGVRLVFNLNPLIRLDGYYLLSDALSLPNLRARAFSYVSARLARLRRSQGPTLLEASPRERRIYLAYGLLALTAEVTVPENGIGDVQVGQPVVLHARALPETSFVGRVTAIVPTAAKEGEAGRGKVVRVTTVVDNAERVLEPAMTGDAKI